MRFISVLNAGDSFVSLDGICLFAAFRSRLNAAFASAISRRIAELFENNLFTSAIVLTEEEVALFASNRFMPATIRLRSACKSIAADTGVVANWNNAKTSMNEDSLRLIIILQVVWIEFNYCRPKSRN